MTNNRRDDDEEDEEYEVEEIRQSRTVRRRKEYLMKWKGYAKCTWVKKSDLFCDDLVAAFEAAQRQKPAADSRSKGVEAHQGNNPSDHDERSVPTSPRIQGIVQMEATIGTKQKVEEAEGTQEREDGDANEDEETKEGEHEGETTTDEAYDYGFDNEYIAPVEAILDKRVAGGCVEYLIQRADADEPDWQTIDALDCDELLEEYERNARQANLPVSQAGAPGKRNTKARKPVSDDGAPSPARGKKKARLAQPLERGVVPARLEGLERAYLGKLVAFSPSTEKWLKAKLYSAVGAAYIVARISDYKYVKKKGLYELRWLDSIFQKEVEKVDISVIMQGRQNYERIMAQPSAPRWLQLCRPSPGETVDVDEDLDELVEYDEFSADPTPSVTLAEVEKIQSMRFEPQGEMRAPTSLYAHEDGTTKTRVKPEHVERFKHSASSSFFAYLPISFWRQVLQHTNDQARASKAPVPFTLDELMKFLGIMWYMALIHKGEYGNYWGEQVEDTIFATTRSTLDGIMPLRRFKQLRSAFCFRDPRTITPNEIKLDAAVRIRSLLNMLKQTYSKYVDVGRNLAVDEASVAARSKFARHLIMYNPRKPTGKYHLKFYMTCCATSWIVLSYRLHCVSLLEQRAAGVHANSATASLASEMDMTSVTRQIVLEITREFHGSSRIVNCDNYYTSVQLLEALRLKGLFCRGTVKQSSKHFPRHVVLPDPKKSAKNDNKSSEKRKTQGEHQEDSDPDEDVEDGDTTVDTQARLDGGTARASGEVKRGDYLQAVCKEAKMLGPSWCDENTVTIISNADTSSIATVE